MPCTDAGRVGRVSPQGVTRQAGRRVPMNVRAIVPTSVGVRFEVGLRFANPTYVLTQQLGEQMQKGAELDQLIRQKLGGAGV